MVTGQIDTCINLVENLTKSGVSVRERAVNFVSTIKI